MQNKKADNVGFFCLYLLIIGVIRDIIISDKKNVV